MAAPTYGSKSAVVSGTATTRTIKTPASTAKNNLVIAIIKVNGANVTVSGTYKGASCSVEQIHNSGAEPHTLAALWIVATESGEVPIEIAWGGASRFNAGIVFRVSGENQSAPIEVKGAKVTETVIKPMTFPSVTTGQKETLSLLIGAVGIEGEGSVTPPSGYVQQQGFSEGCPWLGVGEVAAAGATGEKTATLTTARVNSGIHLIVAPEEVPEEKVFETPARLPISAGTVYYVSTTGSNSTGTGTQGAPYKTVAHALAGKAAGSIIECAGGTYPLEELLNLHGTAQAPLTVRSAAGQTAKFEWSGSGFESFRVSECSYIRFERIEFAENHGEENTNIYCRLGTTHIEFYRCVCHDGQRSNFYTNASTSFIHFVNCISYRAGRRQEATHNLDHGFYLDGETGNVGHMCLNCLAYENDADGFAPHEHTTQSYYVNCTAAYNGRSGFNLGGDMTESYVINCISAFNGQQGEGYGFRDAGSAHGNFVRNVIAYGNIGEPSQFRNANPGYVLGAHKEEDPKFVSAGEKNFRLKAGSPALAYGDTGWAPKFDLNLNNRPASPSVGAYDIAGSIKVKSGGEMKEAVRKIRKSGEWVEA